MLNNPSLWITAVIPTATGIKGGIVDSSSHVFHFSSIRQDLLPSTTDDWAKDAYAYGAPTLTATPEKALLDWIYLSTLSNGRSRSHPPRHDIDMDMLNAERLEHLSQHMGLTQELNTWLAPQPILRSTKKPSLRP